jgi:hypothetical protein
VGKLLLAKPPLPLIESGLSQETLTRKLLKKTLSIALTMAATRTLALLVIAISVFPIMIARGDALANDFKRGVR